MIKTKKTAWAVGGLFFLLATVAWAGTHEVKGKGVTFDPVVVFVKAGDTVAFRNMPTHFVESITIPEGAAAMKSEMGADYDYAVMKDGVYFYKCPPHWGARMGGIIVAGDASGLSATLDEYLAKTDDKTAQSFLKKVKKDVDSGKIKP